MTDHTPAPLVFLDTETTGLTPDDHIWEFAAIRRDPDGREEVFEVLVEHDMSKARQLPPSFLADYTARYQPEAAVTPGILAALVHYVCRSDTDTPYAQRPHIVGAVPDFDTNRLARLMRHHGIEPNWHHHIIDAETLAVGYLAHARRSLAKHGCTMHPVVPPFDSDEVSTLIGVDPDQYARHTALGDVRWAMAIYDAVMKGPVL